MQLFKNWYCPFKGPDRDLAHHEIRVSSVNAQYLDGLIYVELLNNSTTKSCNELQMTAVEARDLARQLLEAAERLDEQAQRNAFIRNVNA